MIWNRIKVLRAERDWTQADLADKVGISRQAVISIEKYKYLRLWSWLLRLQKFLAFLLMKFLSIGRTNSMNEQTIFLIFLVSALAVTLGLYFLKAKKQMQYKGDERWKLIQLNANNAANISNTVLIVLIVVLPLLIDSQTTFTLQRVVTFVLIYIGIRNLIELVATIYLDKQL